MKYNTLNCSGIYVFSTWLNPFLEFAAKEENLVQSWIPWLILLLNITCRSCPEHITLSIIYLHSIDVLLYYKIDYPEFSLNEVKSPNSLSQDHLMGIVLTGYFHFRLALQGKFSLLSISLQILLVWSVKSSERTWQDKRAVPRISISICKWTEFYTGTISAHKDPWCLPLHFPVGQCDRYVWACSPLLSLMNNTLTCHYFGCWVQQWIIHPEIWK